MSNNGAVEADRFSKKPMYVQLRDVLAERISAGAWKPGAVIPNESDLAREFSVSAGTMRKALDLMEAERLLTRRQGRGTFVNDQASDELSLRFSSLRAANGDHLDGQTKTTQVGEDSANELERLRLQLGLHDRIYRIHRTRAGGDGAGSRRSAQQENCRPTRPQRDHREGPSRPDDAEDEIPVVGRSRQDGRQIALCAPDDLGLIYQGTMVPIPSSHDPN